MAYLERAHQHEDTAPTAQMTPGGVSPVETSTGSMIALDTRFGRIEVDPASIIEFRSGLLGFSEARQFVLITLDDKKYEHFRVLQCVDDPSLGFIVFPPSIEGGLIDAADIEAASKAVGFVSSKALVLLLVTVRRENEQSTLSVNLRAPVLIDPDNFRGAQYVLPNDKYPVRFTL